MKKEPSQAAIARELGISGPAVTKLKAQGMPTTSADAARAWRKRNLNIAKMKHDPGPGADTLVARAVNMLQLGADAMRAGRFDLVANEVRASLHAVPVSHRVGIEFPKDVIDALTAGVFQAIKDDAVEPVYGGVEDDAEMSPTELEWLGTFWYSVAAGEWRC